MRYRRSTPTERIWMKNTLLRALATVAVCLPALAQEKDLEPGLVAEYFALGAGPNTFPNIPATMKPAYVRVEKAFDYGDVTGDFYGIRLSDDFYARWTGVLRVEKGGRFELWTESDDGSRLAIDGKVVVDNGGVHPMTVKTGAVDLTAGDHGVKIEVYHGRGAA